MRTTTLPGRVSRAGAVALLTVPAVAVAHLATAGVAASPAGLLVVTVVVLAVTAALPVPGLEHGRTTAWPLAGSVAIAQLAGHAVLATVARPAPGSGGCLSVMGRGAELGLRLALLRQDAACPPGTLAMTTGVTACLAAVLAAVTVVCGQALVAVVGAALLTAGATAWAAARAGLELLAEGLRLFAALLGVVVPGPAPVRAACGERRDVPPLMTDLWHPGVSARRGPPRTA